MKNSDNLPPAPDLPPDLAEPMPIIDVHFAEEDLDEVLTEYRGKEETEKAKKRIYGGDK